MSTELAPDLVLLARAADYAARQHIAQRRKGERAEPYINHLIEVAALLAEATDGSDAVLLMGGLLHDTLEDTDDKSLPKEERKRLQIEKTPAKSRRAKLLKVADKTSNLRGLITSPPVGWTEARLRDYVVWANDVVQSCRGLNPRLEAAFDEAHEKASRHFG
jgi:hypothetical protein